MPLPTPHAPALSAPGRSRRRWLQHTAAATAGAALSACGGMGAADGEAADALAAYPRMPDGPAPGASPRMVALAATLGRGINFGNMLESPREGDWGLTVRDEFIGLVGDGGFTRSVRLPVRWSNHADADAAARIDPAFMDRVDGVVTRLLARGVTVVLNMHHYRQLDGDTLDSGEARVAAALVRPRFLAMWRQIAERFAGHDAERLVFELYNEPHGAQESDWNDLLSRAVRLVRQSNPQRALVVGPTQWNNPGALPRLVLPPDANLLLTVHHYEPFNFTHQGANWISPMLPTGQDCCSATQTATVIGLLDQAVRECTRLGYPCFVGEFGAYEAAPMAARVRHARLMRDAMAQRNLPWFYWELASGFGVYDPAAGAFRPALTDALFGA